MYTEHVAFYKCTLKYIQQILKDLLYMFNVHFLAHVHHDFLQLSLHTFCIPFAMLYFSYELYMSNILGSWCERQIPCMCNILGKISLIVILKCLCCIQAVLCLQRSEIKHTVNPHQRNSLGFETYFRAEAQPSDFPTQCHYVCIQTKV